MDELETLKQQLYAQRKTIIEDSKRQLQKDLDEAEKLFVQNLDLEKLPYMIYLAGMEWVKWQALAKRAEDLKKSLLARLQLFFYRQTSKITASRVEVEALATKDYDDHINATHDLTKAANEAKEKKDLYQNIFEARRTLNADERVRLQKGVHY